MLALCRAGVQANASWQSLGRVDPAGPAHSHSGRIARWANAMDPERALVQCILIPLQDISRHRAPSLTHPLAVAVTISGRTGI